jgi:EAL domain-containing protein (putative c-di-GMP-specific phosphodiesterase class I)
MNKPIDIGDIAQGLAKKEFLLHYQPIVSLLTGHVCGVEALVRWQKPDGCLIPPAAFIPLAEESGYVSEITNAIVPMLFSDLQEMDQFAPGLMVSFNASSKDFTGRRLADTLSKQLDKTGIEPGRVWVEVTESAFVPFESTTREALYEIRDLGIKIALDDFSASHFTLEHLSQLPFSMLKIALPLVQRIAGSAEDLAVLSHLVDVGHQLNYSVVAGGVETEELHELVLSTGCTSAQGYYYGYPLPLPGFANLMAKHPIWENYPFGSIRLAQVDIVDFTRGVLREVMIEHTSGDQQVRQRAHARLTELRCLETHFTNWYTHVESKCRACMPDKFTAIGREFEELHRSSVDLIHSVEGDGQTWKSLEAKIDSFTQQSAHLSQMLLEVAAKCMLKMHCPVLAKSPAPIGPGTDSIRLKADQPANSAEGHQT